MSRPCLGFDFGEKRIGIAVGHRLTGTASPLQTITPVNDKPDWQSIGKLVEEWQPECCVVGLPLNMDGSETSTTSRARRFARQLESRFAVAVHMADERLTSAIAAQHIREGRQKGTRGKTRKGDDDKIAAALILEQWLESSVESS